MLGARLPFEFDIALLVRLRGGSCRMGLLSGRRRLEADAFAKREVSAIDAKRNRPGANEEKLSPRC